MSKSIVIFYSWAGHTRRMAEAIAAETGADLLEIQPREAYPASYRETLRRSKAELDTGRLPDIQPAGQDLKGYDTVYIGSPVWYGTIAPPLTVYLKGQQLAGKRVLVVHPFKTTIERQYARRAELFPGTDILPQFADLRIVQAVQGLAGADTGYASWFDALAAMEQQMDAAPYDVAIIGAGAYGLPLAAHARDTGHAAIQMSGALQLLFGIRGKRWDDHPIISKLYNDAWVRPEETLAHKEKVEGGSYW